MSESESVAVVVKCSGSDNVARVHRKNIVASCTSSPDAAAARAATKYFGQEPEHIVEITDARYDDRFTRRYRATGIRKEAA